MVLDLDRPSALLDLVNDEQGLVDRRIFSDPAIYQLELERIFARAWNFMAHDSQIPNPGDYFMTYIGEDRVIVVRDEDGNPQVLLNSCRHRGNAVCRAEEGNTSSFMCTYHGWTYDLKGKLVGVPGFKEVYHEELDRENWGLIKAAQVESYKGFIFATMDPQAPSLSSFLGHVGRLSLDLVAERGSGAIELLPGIQKYIIQCNWKLAADNVWDFYHPEISHRSAFMSGVAQRMVARTPSGGPPAQRNRLLEPHMVLLGEYGQALAGPENTEALRATGVSDETWRERPGMAELLGPVGMRVGSHPHIFPNCWITYPGFAQISLRLPKGPDATEIWWFTFVDKQASAEEKARMAKRAMSVFGPAGMLEQDDGENWGESTKATRGVVLSRFPLNYSMGIGQREMIHEEGQPPYAEGLINEHAQLWHYRNWAAWMAATSWPDLERNRPDVPEQL